MSITVVGSVALDTVISPFGRADEALGGSAVYAAVAASSFSPVQLVGVVGEDFPQEAVAMLKGKNIDTAGLEVVPGRTFRWTGEYAKDMNQRETLDLQLNVFADFHPKLPEAYRETKTVFLANIDPDLQLEVLDQVKSPELVVCDTMDIWIDTKRESLVKLLGKVHAAILNDGEALQLTGEPNAVLAGRAIQKMGPGIVIVKKGEHGAMLFNGGNVFCAPALPLEQVFDPTGAGDSFAGGFVGYLEQSGVIDDAAMRNAVVYGSCTASFTVQSFSVDALKDMDAEKMEGRFNEFRRLTAF